jgi:hypothetical protein
MAHLLYVVDVCFVCKSSDQSFLYRMLEQHGQLRGVCSKGMIGLLKYCSSKLSTLCSIL